MIIEAEIYGRIVKAKIVILPKAPPENMLNIPRTPLFALLTISDKAIELIPETLIVCLTKTPSNHPHLLFRLATGETIQIAAKNAPAFKAAKGLKDALN